MLEVRQALSRMHHAQRRSMMRELPNEALQVLACATKGGRGRERWTFGVPAGEGGGGESDEGDVKEGQEGPHSSQVKICFYPSTTKRTSLNRRSQRF